MYLVPKNNKLDQLPNELADYALNTLEFSGALNQKVINLGPKSDNIVIVGLGEEDGKFNT